MSKLTDEQQKVLDAKLKAALAQARKDNDNEELTKDQIKEVTDKITAEFDESPAAKKARLAKEEADAEKAKAVKASKAKAADVMMPHDKLNEYKA
jgi:hypothetical protein